MSLNANFQHRLSNLWSLFIYILYYYYYYVYNERQRHGGEDLSHCFCLKSLKNQLDEQVNVEQLLARGVELAPVTAPCLLNYICACRTEMPPNWFLSAQFLRLLKHQTTYWCQHNINISFLPDLDVDDYGRSRRF